MFKNLQVRETILLPMLPQSMDAWSISPSKGQATGETLAMFCQKLVVYKINYNHITKTRKYSETPLELKVSLRKG